MKKFLISMALMLFTFTLSHSQAIDPYLGRWALNLKRGPGWLEIRQEPGYMDGSMLWLWGSVEPLENVYLDGKVLKATRSREIIREKDEQGKVTKKQVITNLLEISVKGDKMEGKTYTPTLNGRGVETEEFTGKKIPDHNPPPDLSKIRFGEPVNLLPGNNLTGWRLLEEGAKNGWKLENGVLVNDPVQPEEGGHINYGNLRTDAVFEDFNLKLEVNVPEGSNSGIYLKGIYEVQVMDSYHLPLDSHHMGAIYSRIIPSEKAEKPAGEWQTMDITLVDRYITVMLNGKTIINNQPLLGITGGAITSDEMVAGPLYLQGDHGKVSYRSIVVRSVIK